MENRKMAYGLADYGLIIQWASEKKLSKPLTKQLEKCRELLTKAENDPSESNLELLGVAVSELGAIWKDEESKANAIRI
jgi:hypothetical protein